MRKHKRQNKPTPHPVALAVFKNNLQRDATLLGLHCLSADHKSEQRKLLADLARIISLGVEIAKKSPKDANNAEGLHQCLHEIILMANSGCEWDTEWAVQMHTAVVVSNELIVEFPAIAYGIFPGACQLADEIFYGHDVSDSIHPYVPSPS